MTSFKLGQTVRETLTARRNHLPRTCLLMIAFEQTPGDHVPSIPADVKSRSVILHYTLISLSVPCLPSVPLKAMSGGVVISGLMQ